ncbi:MAG: DUF3857 domain-containing protein [Bacteroidota bacterium]
MIRAVGIWLGFFCVCWNVHSQPAPFKWGNVNKEEIRLQKCEYEPEASAVILKDYGLIKLAYGLPVSIDRYRRIKILSKEGVDQANITIPFYAKDKFEKIFDVKAQTISIGEKGQIKKTKIHSSEIFTVDLNDDWKAIKFTFPSVSEGAILEYTYRLYSENYRFLDAWRFQNKLPTLNSEVRAEIESGIKFRAFLQGRRLTEKYLGKQVNRWALTDLPSLRDEPFVFNYETYTEMLKFQMESYYNYGSSALGSESPSHNVMIDSWEKLSEEILDAESLKKYLNRPSKASDILNGLNVENTMNDLGLMKAIYQEIKNQIEWDGRYRIFPDKNLRELVEAKKGNSAEINLLLVAMLRSAGIKAQPALVRTRSHGRINTSFPLLSQFNQIIGCAELNGKLYMLDATDKLRPYNLLDFEDLNEKVFLLDKNEPKWVKVKEPALSEEVVVANIDLSDLERIKNDFDIKLTGYAALEKRHRIYSTDQPNVIGQFFDTRVKKLKSDSLAVSGLEDFGKPLKIKYFYVDRHSDAKPDRLVYFKPVQVNRFENNPFKSQHREYPVEFPYSYQFNYKATIDIPKDYEVANVPKEVSTKLPNNYGTFTYQVLPLGNRLQMSTKVTLKRRFIPLRYYSNLQEFYDLIISKLNEPIVLEKIGN